jgi:hypothetical protein
VRSVQRFKAYNDHARLEGTHAFLSPSNYHWLRYDKEKLLKRLETARAAARGTSLHKLAAHAISEGVQLMPDGSTLSMYVNDVIKYKMEPERALFFSMDCYGTADAIGFEIYVDLVDDVLGYLRIFDLKTGVSNCSVEQLYVYAAVFCLEYGYRPYEIEGELRLYQNDAVDCYEIDRVVLTEVISTILSHQRIIDEYRLEGEE